MGVATTRSMERIAAALGGLDEAAPLFERADDIPNGGVLCALPALLHLGLLRHSENHFQWPKGFYSMASIFVLLAFLALGRLRSLEQLRYQAPGEWGKLLGLDRVPEVKTMREKIGLLGDDAQRTAEWSRKLVADWMNADVGAAGVLLIDGHTRVYHGKLAALPRRYIAREKLCLRATTDYWVNAMNGDPFFCVTKAIDPGLIKTLEEDIVPRLLKEVPGQPSEQQLEADLLLHCFTLIFDREGYSPDLFKRMKEIRIAILTYKKNPGEPWAQEEFEKKSVKMSNGEIETLRLAERGTQLSNGLWIREVRLLGENGHQTAVLSTDYKSGLTVIAASMFARWNQENFFKYMRQHYGLDQLIEYGISPLPDTTRLVNPVWRGLDGKVRSLVGKLVKKRAQFGAMTIDFENEEAEIAKNAEPSKGKTYGEEVREPDEKAEAKTAKAQAKVIEKYETQKGHLLEEIQAMEKDVSEWKAKKKESPRHVMLKDLPVEQRVSQLHSARKHFVDTIKLLAYRAETTLVGLIKETLGREDESRSFVRAILKTSVNLRPNPAEGVLEIQLHGQANPMHDECAAKLCRELNETETKYPGTDLRLKYTTLRPEKKSAPVE